MDRLHKEMTKKIKKARLFFKLSQTALAKKLGVSYATVNRWENSITYPSPLAESQVNSFIQDYENAVKQVKK